MYLAKVAIFLLWLGAVVDPIGNTFGIRYLALATALAAIAWLLLTGSLNQLDKSYRGFLIFLLAGVLPVYGLFLYSFRASEDEFIDTSYLASGLLILTSLLYRNQRMCEFGIKSLVISTRIMSFLVIAGYASEIFSMDGWLGFFTERNVALISYREYSGITFPYIYFLASPLLILLMAYDFGVFRQRATVMSFIIFLLTSFSFALTGTRAHILIALTFAPLYILLTSTSRTIIKALSLCIILTLGALSLEESRIIIGAFFSASETSNSMKLSMLDGYSKIFSEPQALLLGQGFNAHEWSQPVREMIAMEEKASKTELTYLELVRVFGIGLATLFIGTLLSLLKSAKSLHVDKRWIYPGFAIYLANATINPYLFSVNGMLPLGLIAAITHYYRPPRATIKIASAMLEETAPKAR
jgi:hypothetical protein